MRNIALFILTIIALWTVGFAYYIYLANSYKTDSTTTDAIAVIAGGGNRIETAVSLLNAGYAPVLFITGISNSDQLKNLLKEYNVKDEQVVYAPNIVLSEKEYAQKIANFITSKNLKSIRLVASNYSMPIILNEIEELLLGTQIRIATTAIVSKYGYKILINSYIKYLLSNANYRV